MNQVLKVHPQDNVLVALQPLQAGDSVLYDGILYNVKEPIAAKHKLLMKDLLAGDEIIMYGVLVGKATLPIAAGERIGTHNVHHAAEPYEYRPSAYTWTPPDVSQYAHRQFMGYHRSNGSVGTANYWLFIPTVFCENRNLDVIKEALNAALGYGVTDKYRAYAEALATAYKAGESIESLADTGFQPLAPKTKLFPNIDGIKFLNHQGGCGGIRQDAAVLGKLLAAYADHPNVAGVTILSLGCQNLQTSELLAELKQRNPHFDKPLLVYEQQQVGSEEQLIQQAIQSTFAWLIKANEQSRQPAPLSKLCVGVKCGGSDGFSGISANPAVGHCSDLLVALGAQVLLAEFPELCGVEQELIDRMPHAKDAHKFIALMKRYEENVAAVGSGFHMNPSPGNIKDGLITDAMKSAGAARKGGTSPIVEVLDYTEPATRPGLHLVCTPGNDVEATTGKAASGATLILFTTGLGTPTGNPVCPTIKVATNTPLAQRMSSIIDFDTGTIITGQHSIAQVGELLLEHCIQVASGHIVPKAVALLQDDFIPWKRGVSL